MWRRFGQMAVCLMLATLLAGSAFLLCRAGVRAVRTRSAVLHWTVEHEASVGTVGSPVSTDYVEDYSGPVAVRFGGGCIAIGAMLAGWAVPCLVKVFFTGDRHIFDFRPPLRRSFYFAVFAVGLSCVSVAQCCFFSAWPVSSVDVLETFAFVSVIVTALAAWRFGRTAYRARRFVSVGVVVLGAELVFAEVTDTPHAVVIFFGMVLAGVLAVQALALVRIVQSRGDTTGPRLSLKQWNDFRRNVRPAFVRSA